MALLVMRASHTKDTTHYVWDDVRQCGHCNRSGGGSLSCLHYGYTEKVLKHLHEWGDLTASATGVAAATLAKIATIAVTKNLLKVGDMSA